MNVLYICVKPKRIMILQKLKYNVEDNFMLSEKYFGMMNILNSWELAKKEIEFLSYVAISGNIGSDRNKEEFVKKYSSSLSTVGNMISKLNKMGLLSKESKKKIYINNALAPLDFSKDLVLQITLIHNVPQ